MKIARSMGVESCVHYGQARPPEALRKTTGLCSTCSLMSSTRHRAPTGCLLPNDAAAIAFRTLSERRYLGAPRSLISRVSRRSPADIVPFGSNSFCTLARIDQCRKICSLPYILPIPVRSKCFFSKCRHRTRRNTEPFSCRSSCGGLCAAAAPSEIGPLGTWLGALPIRRIAGQRVSPHCQEDMRSAS